VKVGEPNAGEDMTFDFTQLIAHVAKTRNARAGSIIGSGTSPTWTAAAATVVLQKKRSLEMTESGRRPTPFMKYGDTVRIEMFDDHGRSVFGAIEQRVAPPAKR